LSTLLVRHADMLLTMDSEPRRILDGAIFVRDNVIEGIGPSAELPVTADKVVEARGKVVLPGLINTHHHLFQTLTRAVPGAQNANLFDWLNVLFPIWTGLTKEAIYISALVGMAELVLSGCTTASDHLYMFPNGARIDDEIRAAQEIGLRFHASRGSLNLGQSQGGLPPDQIIEDIDDILRDMQRVIEKYHEAEYYGLIRVDVAPCSPFSVTPDLMREAARLGRSYGVQLHTHLAETLDEQEYCLERFGCRPLDYAAELGWVGDDVWYAHAVHINPSEIKLMAQTGTGVCHCPSSNMRLASGIAPIHDYREQGVRVGLGVDGSASSDSSHMLAEARQALLLGRISPGRPHGAGDPAGLTADDVLEMATVGGARVLGRDDIGSLEPGKAADFIAFDLNQLGFAGALHDPVAALVFCTPPRVDLSVINGRIIVQDGRLTMVEIEPVVERHNQIARALVNGSGHFH
jgi:8-oxoguanine deaminase